MINNHDVLKLPRVQRVVIFTDIRQQVYFRDVPEGPEAILEEQIFKDHGLFPAKAKPGKFEELPATLDSLVGFNFVLQKKISTYHHLTNSQRELFKKIPLSFEYEAFFLHYWPGSLLCCQKSFTSSKSFFSHFSDTHSPYLLTHSLPSLSLPNLNLINMDENEAPAASNSDNNTANESRKRKSYSPSSKPGPKSSKQPKLTGQEMVKIPNTELLNSVTSNADASIDSLAENGSDNDKSSSRPKRTQKQQKITDYNFEANKEIEDDELVNLENDQMKYPPQHEPGKDEDFPATLKRTKYFSEVLALKIGKYNHLNSFKPTSSLKHIPLAMTIAGFTHYYWPGRVICCGLIRPSVTELEKHINRAHRPPKPLPILSVPPGAPKEESASEDEKIEEKIEPTKSSDKKSLKLPAGINDDQNRYPPQHKPGDAEDYKANEETIQYFIEALKLKREKYGHLNLKDKAANIPLSLAIGQFMLYYWPGMLNCCGRVFTKCKEFQSHISASHGSKGKALKPTVLTEEVPVVRIDSDAMDRSPSVSPLPPPKSNRRNRSSTATNGSNGSGPSHQTSSASPQPSASRNDQTSLEDRPMNTSMVVPAKLEAVQEEARKLRRQSEQAQTLKDLMPVLVRVLELGAALAERTRSFSSTDRGDQDERSNHIEVLEYVWNVSKKGISRWEEMKSSRDSLFLAVQYAYSTLPMFMDWDKAKDLESAENVIILSLNSARRWSAPSAPNLTEEKKTPKPPSRRTTMKQEKRNSLDTPRQSSPEEEETDVTPPSSSTKAKGNKVKDLKALQDFCRFTNIAITQNTKNRSGTGYKDDDGNFNAMYRYGISQILKLYCPPDVSHLKCCERVFDLNTLRVHVLEKHEGGGKSNKTESSIAPP